MMPISDDEELTESAVLQRVGVWMRCKATRLFRDDDPVAILVPPRITFEDVEAFERGEWPSELQLHSRKGLPE